MPSTKYRKMFIGWKFFAVYEGHHLKVHYLELITVYNNDGTMSAVDVPIESQERFLIDT